MNKSKNILLFLFEVFESFYFFNCNDRRKYMKDMKIFNYIYDLSLELILCETFK